VFTAVTCVLWLGLIKCSRDLERRATRPVLLYAGFVGTSAAALSEMWGELQRAAGAMDRLTELLEARPPSRRPPSDRIAAADPGRHPLRQCQLSLSIASDTAALNNLSLEVMPGETVAFVALRAPAKARPFNCCSDSTTGPRAFAHRRCRLTDLRPEDIRAQIGLVPQDTVLFGASARENIRYGRRVRTMRRLKPLPWRLRPTDSCESFLKGTIPFSVSAARVFREASGSASRWREPF